MKRSNQPPTIRSAVSLPRFPPLYLFTSRLNSNWSLTSEPPALWASPSRRGCLPAQNSFHNRRKALPGLGLVIAAIARASPALPPSGRGYPCRCSSPDLHCGFTTSFELAPACLVLHSIASSSQHLRFA